ncbi:MAG: glycosyltransferase family 39 protein [Chloroflexales bacterium]
MRNDGQPKVFAFCILHFALALRLLAWRWHEFYALGGDEREYLEQAVRLLRDHQYVELHLMRPPLYPFFLAGCVYLVDSLVQNLRLVQALISAATVPLVYLLAREVAWRSDGSARRTPALLAALLCALSYTLAANASELLTEALFLCGLTTALWLLLRAARTGGLVETTLAGLIIGALCLLRSVALPLLPLGAVWMGINAKCKMQNAKCEDKAKGKRQKAKCEDNAQDKAKGKMQKAKCEDNAQDKAKGKMQNAKCEDNAQDNAKCKMQNVKCEVNAQDKAKCKMQNVKCEINAREDGGRQGVARYGMKQGAVQFCILTFAFCIVLFPWAARNYVTYGGLILIDTTGAENLWLDNDPAGREVVKAQLYALGDDRLARQRLATQRGVAVIVADPARFAAKAWGELTKLFALEFSDDLLARPAIWVSLPEVAARLLLGDGVWLLLLLAGVFGLIRSLLDGGLSWKALANPAWLLLPWALYVVLTTVIFHVELRYRLPLYPALLPYAGLALAGVRVGYRLSAIGYRLLAIFTLVACLALMLLHMNYPALAWRLGWKHWDLGRAEVALGRGDVATARQAALAALAWDDGSALARVALARADLLAGDQAAAMAQFNGAVRALPAHPYAHLLRGDLLRRQGQTEAARGDLAYETSSREDLQSWAWARFTSDPPARLALGDGLDLGFIRGMQPVREGEHGFRWTTGDAEVRLTAPPGATTLRLGAASGRPDGAATEVGISLDGRDAGTILISADGGVYVLALPVRHPNTHEIVVGLRSRTFTPRDYDRASPDGRILGVKLEVVEILTDVASCAKETNVLYCQ